MPPARPQRREPDITERLPVLGRQTADLGRPQLESISMPGQGQLADDLIAALLTGRAKAEPEVEALGPVLSLRPGHRRAGLPTSANLLAHGLHREAAISPALLIGGDVQPPDPGAGRVIRVVRVETDHEEAHDESHRCSPSKISRGQAI